MIVAVVAAAALPPAPSREALIGRWLAANRAHVRARLESGVSNSAPPSHLQVLAARELAVPGRYRLAQLPAATARAPWWLPAWQWLRDRWKALWLKLFARTHVGHGAAVAVGDVLIALSLFAIVIVGSRLLMQLQFQRRTRRAQTESIVSPPDARALYEAACAAARCGDYGAASSLLFAATLAALDLQGIAPSDRSATVGDLRRRLRARNRSLLAPFDTIAFGFTTHVYAERRVDANAWERAREAFAAMLPEARPS